MNIYFYCPLVMLQHLMYAIIFRRKFLNATHDRQVNFSSMPILSSNLHGKPSNWKFIFSYRLDLKFDPNAYLHFWRKNNTKAIFSEICFDWKGGTNITSWYTYFTQLKIAMIPRCQIKSIFWRETWCQLFIANASDEA